MEIVTEVRNILAAGVCVFLKVLQISSETMYLPQGIDALL